MPYLLLRDVPRYECLQEASSRVAGFDPGICELFLNVLHTGDVASRSEAEFLARFGLNQARLIVLVLLDRAENGSLRSSELADPAVLIFTPSPDKRKGGIGVDTGIRCVQERKFFWSRTE